MVPFLAEENNLGFGAELRTVKQPQRAATQEGNLVCRVTRDFTFQMKLHFCF